MSTASAQFDLRCTYLDTLLFARRSPRRTRSTERLYDRTARRLAGLAFVEQMREHTIDAAQIGHSCAYLLAPHGGDSPHLGAVRTVREVEQRFDLLQRETELLRTLHEPDALDVFRAVAAICAVTAFGLGTDCHYEPGVAHAAPS